MMQMLRESRAVAQGRRPAVAAAVVAAMALSCGLGWARVAETAPQQGVPPTDLGPRAMQRQGYPPLPPRPGTPESRLPPTAPTQAPPQPSPATGTPAPGLTAVPSPTVATMTGGETSSTTPHPAQVSFADGLLEVRANDSSLHQILRSVARRTGMKITGGVADQRVFGNYGPAPAASVLATLLDGTGVNILLQTTPAQVPVSLVLTPLTGGASPPTLDMTMNDDTVDGRSATPSASGGEPLRPTRQENAGPGSYGPVSVPQPYNNVNGSSANVTPTASQIPTTNSVPLDSLPTPSTTPSSNGIVDTPNPPPPGSTTSQSPNGVATPETIYQQLLQLQKQQQQKQQGGTTPP